MVRKSSQANKKSKKGKRRVDSDDNSEDDDWNSDEETTSTVQNRATSSSGTLLHGGQPGHLVHVQPPPHQRFQVPRVQDDQDDESLFGDEAEFDAAARRQIQPQGHPHLPHQHISDMRHHANQVLHYSGGSMDDNDKHFMEQMDMYSNTFGHHQQHLPQQQNPQMGGQQPNMILNMPSLMLPNFTGVHYQPGQLPHPQLHFSGMHHMANAQGPSATSHHPSMQQHHVLQVEPHQPAEEVHKLNVYTSENRKVTKIASVNLFQKVFLGRHNINPALSKPSFCPVRNELFVCGTEDQDPSKRQHNRLIFCSIDSESVVNPLFSCQIADYVRDLQWIDSQFIVFAVNQKLGLVRMSQNSLAVEDIVMFPEFHKDAIREICVSEGSKNLVISGGFDGNVFVTDISRLCTDIQKNEKKSENSLYPCRDVVGSVSWHPYDSCLASCTTDTGTIHIFDIRTDKRRPAIVYDSQKPELYTHAYKDSTTILLGYGDGQIHAFDTRIKRSFMSFQDPHQKQIGEIRFDYSMKSFAVFGVPAYTLWSFDENSLSLNAHEVIADTAMINQIPYKTSGEFRKGTGTFGVTDSLGTFCLYQMGNELR